MSRILSGTRFLIIVPIVGLALAASFLFIVGGISLVKLLIDTLVAALGMSHNEAELDTGVVIFHLVEYVHTFLVGTVLYITAIGLYQLFVHEIELPQWLEIHNTEELETNLISVTVVVLAVNFMGVALTGQVGNLLDFGAGVALPIAALALFVGLRAWATRAGKSTTGSGAIRRASPHSEATGQGVAEGQQ